jgi:hypothetical protein
MVPSGDLGRNSAGIRCFGRRNGEDDEDGRDGAAAADMETEAKQEQPEASIHEIAHEFIHHLFEQQTDKGSNFQT